jgi:hypothetical protein
VLACSCRHRLVAHNAPQASELAERWQATRQHGWLTNLLLLLLLL